ncbi:hypothetical protein GCM10020331_082380 [Ectobacillus funiculus]
MDSTKSQPLSQFTTGHIVRLERIELQGTLKRRLLDLGFIPGAIVKVLQKKPAWRSRCLSSKQYNYRVTKRRKLPYILQKV